MKSKSRRSFIKDFSVVSGGICLLPSIPLSACTSLGSNMKLGLVTYNWGKNWDIPTIIKNCTETGILGVELRVDHAHGVSPKLSNTALADVKKMFDDSPVEIVGMGTNEQFDSPDANKLGENIERAKEFIRISHAIGGSGVKVKPNKFHEGVPREKTTEQIGHSLSILGDYATDYGQSIRLEVHGSGTDELPVIKAIMEHATNPNVGVCWNCNDTDLEGEGLEHNFNLVKDRFGETVHVRELNIGEYPYQELINLFVGMDYKGWVMLECRKDPEDVIDAMNEQRKLFRMMIANAK